MLTSHIGLFNQAQWLLSNL